MPTCLRLTCGLGFVFLCFSASRADGPAEPVKLESVLVTLIEQVEVPAQESGALAKMMVLEGNLVRMGDLLAKVEDTDVRLAEDKAKIELDIARSEAANDLKVRIAQKAHDVAQSELRRAKESVATYPKSVSGTEMDRLTLTADKTAFEVDQAKHEREITRLTLALKQNEVQQAQRKVARRQVFAPLDGMVVQIHRHPGEWVEPGEKVIRLVRLNRLRVEGFISSKEAARRLPGTRVQLVVDLPQKPQAHFEGGVTFISPEINPVNGQVRLWAEIDNRDLQLRPGMRGTLILPPKEN